MLALHRAVLDEWATEQLYQQMSERFGESRRLQRLVAAEGRHAALLLDLCARYDIDAPSRDELLACTLPEDYAGAVQQAIEHERGNVAMFDELLGGVDAPDVKAVFQHLRNRSLTRHLPAWERAAESLAGRGI